MLSLQKLKNLRSFYLFTFHTLQEASSAKKWSSAKKRFHVFAKQKKDCWYLNCWKGLLGL